MVNVIILNESSCLLANVFYLMRPFDEFSWINRVKVLMRIVMSIDFTCNMNSEKYVFKKECFEPKLHRV